MKINRTLRLCSTMVVVALWIGSAYSYSGGPPDGVAANPPDYDNCTLCHSTYPVNIGPGGITITSLPSTYVSGATYVVGVTLSDPAALRWGFELTALDPSNGAAGVFSIFDPTNTQLSDHASDSADFVKHTMAGTFPGIPGSVSWHFDWTAPNNTDDVTFYFAGNAANFNSTTTGDYIYTDSLVIPAAYPVFIELTPIGATSFPAAGGALDYNIAGTNTAGTPQTVDIWVDVTLPSATIFGPVLGPVQNFTMPPSFSTDRDRELNIPPGAPAGDYALNAYMGEYDQTNPVIYSEDHFGFSKSAVGGELSGVSAWFVDTGEPFEVEASLAASPENYALGQNYPNPFNPTTNLSFTLPEAAKINLTVYDVSGRLVTTLVNGWRDAGTHNVHFDASGLASGIYIYRLKAGDFSASGKMVLMK